MSIQSKCIEIGFKAIHLKSDFQEKNYEKIINRANNRKFNIPNNLKKYERINLKNYNIYTKYNDNYNKIIIYIHGGAFINEINKYHVNYLNCLLSNNPYKIVVPLYPLLPKNDYKKSFELLLDLYNELLKENKEIIFMGDSAGGGLSISFSQYLKTLNIKQPDKLVLFSPWVDVSMENSEIDKYESIDPVLSKYGLKQLGKIWANELDVKDYKVSPIYGDLDIPKTLLFIGTKEIFYPDNILFFNKLDKDKSQLIIGEGLTHVYPIYPVKEGHEAVRNIIDFINK